MQALRKWLEVTRTTQAEFSREMGISQPTLHGILTGKHSAGSVLLKRISLATRISIDDLLADLPVPPIPSKKLRARHAA
jgi:transcriptional regulator with XRE-family HTH domain